MDRFHLHPFDSLFRRGRHSTSSAATSNTTTTTTTASTQAGRPFSAQTRRGVERWIHETRAAASGYAPVSPSDDEDEDDDAVSCSSPSPFPAFQDCYSPLPCSSPSPTLSPTATICGHEDEEEQEQEQESTRGRSRTRTRTRSRGRGRGLAMPAVPPLLCLAREDAGGLVSPVSSGTRSSSRVSALSGRGGHADADWDADAGVDGDGDVKSGLPIYVIPPSTEDGDEDGDGGKKVAWSDDGSESGGECGVLLR